MGSADVFARASSGVEAAASRTVLVAALRKGIPWSTFSAEPDRKMPAKYRRLRRLAEAAYRPAFEAAGLV